MTDNDIVKAMICCTNFPVCDRDNCPYGESTNCATMLGKDVVELINRQKAEIERLKEEQEKCFYCTEQSNKKIGEIKAEAIKELMFNLDNEISTYSSAGKDLNVYAWLKNYAKEKVGE